MRTILLLSVFGRGRYLLEIVVGEGLFVTAFLTLRAAALRRCLATLGANLVEGSYLPQI